MSIEVLIEKERWSETRALLGQALKLEPRHHWLLTRISLTYYEQRLYSDALKYSMRAFAEAPECPLVLWDYAGALQMLDRDLRRSIFTLGWSLVASTPLLPIRAARAGPGHEAPCPTRIAGPRYLSRRSAVMTPVSQHSSSVLTFESRLSVNLQVERTWCERRERAA
jgi:tetratricopeptide (TPR) repeat protein